MPESKTNLERATEESIATARRALDAHVHETVQWHFDPSTGCPFWLQYAKDVLKFDPLHEINTYDDLK